MLRSDLVGHIMVNQRANYQLTAITLGMILLGGTILGSTPFAFADDDDDRKKRLIELIAKIRDHLDDDDDKCKEKKKYQGECDLERPEIEIEEPEKGDKLQAGMITIEIEAEDEESGLKKVEVRINKGPFLPATQVDDDEWEFKVNLVPGKYKITAKATDNVNNKSRDTIKIKVV